MLPLHITTDNNGQQNYLMDTYIYLYDLDNTSSKLNSMSACILLKIRSVVICFSSALHNSTALLFDAMYGNYLAFSHCVSPTITVYVCSPTIFITVEALPLTPCLLS